MIFGKLDFNKHTLETLNDNYDLASITAVSTRRPFLSAGLLIGGLTALFGMAFHDILYPRELVGLSIASAVALFGGLCVGQLKLVSRDLRGSPLADAVYGTYWDLKRQRPQILSRRDRARERGAS